MKFISLDIETSSLYPSRGQVLELGVIIDDLAVKVDRADLEEYIEQLPKFHCYIKHPNVVGDHYAVSMHPRIWQVLTKEPVVKDYYDYELRLNNKSDIVLTPDFVSYYFTQFLSNNNLLESKVEKVTSIVVAGKNVAGFDVPWLKTLPVLS